MIADELVCEVLTGEPDKSGRSHLLMSLFPPVSERDTPRTTGFQFNHNQPANSSFQQQTFLCRRCQKREKLLAPSLHFLPTFCSRKKKKKKRKKEREEGGKANLSFLPLNIYFLPNFPIPPLFLHHSNHPHNDSLWSSPFFNRCPTWEQSGQSLTGAEEEEDGELPQRVCRIT